MVKVYSAIRHRELHMSIFTVDDVGGRQAASRAVASGKLIRLATGLYSDEVRRTAEDIVRSRWAEIVGKLLPEAVITDRTGFSGTPVDGHLYVDHPRLRELALPGLTIVPSGNPDAGPSPGDTPTGTGIYIASEQRALLDNLRTSRAVKGRPPRTLTRDELHDQVVRLTTSRTAEQRERLLGAVNELGAATGRTDMTDSIILFFQAAAGERPTVKSGSRSMKAAQAGSRYDTGRARLFKSLATQLSSIAPRPRPEPRPGDRTYLPFFEAYFSNYIEGTEFTVDEAAQIALHGQIPDDRPEDAHDIAGTYRIVNDLEHMRKPIDTADDLIAILKHRHAAIMKGRPNKNPGQFKARGNRAGMTEFVAPDMVEGTLRAGWHELESIDDPFARATFMMFLISEVHPFDDGNGRAARIMMNGELLRLGESRIIIPTVIRDEYLSGLTALTHNDRSAALVSVLDFAQRYTRQVDFTDFDQATRTLTETGAFLTSKQAEEQYIRLTLPNSVVREFSPASRGQGVSVQERRKNTGEPGNGGLYTGKRHDEDDIELPDIGL